MAVVIQGMTFKEDLWTKSKKIISCYTVLFLLKVGHPRILDFNKNFTF
jgi:hypothetical protein